MEILNAIHQHRFFKQHGPACALALAIAFLLLIVVDVYSDGRQISERKGWQYAEPRSAAKSAKTQYRIEDAVAANLLGNPVQKAKPQPKKAPTTTLKLELQGLLYSNIQNEARAIIKHKNKANLYSVGEKIKGTQVSVKEILESEVLLDRNGSTETLPLIKKAQSGNREILTFSNSSDKDASLIVAQSLSPPDGSPRATKAQPAEPRRIKKPNFSGLDKALEKMGEL